MILIKYVRFFMLYINIYLKQKKIGKVTKVKNHRLIDVKKITHFDQPRL